MHNQTGERCRVRYAKPTIEANSIQAGIEHSRPTARQIGLKDITCADMVLGKPRNPIKISYVTDTRPVTLIDKVVKNSNLFICEGMYGEDAKFNSAIEKMHMTFSEAANIALKADVKELWLTHFSPSMSKPEEYIDTAKSIFQNTYVGHDLMRKQLKINEK